MIGKAFALSVRPTALSRSLLTPEALAFTAFQ